MTQTAIIGLDSSNFDAKMLDSELPAVAFFWAGWCSLSTTILPILEKLAADYKGQINVGRVDIGEHPMLTNDYRIDDTPTLIFFHKGNLLRRLTGDPSQGRLEEMFAHLAEVAEAHA